MKTKNKVIIIFLIALLVFPSMRVIAHNQPTTQSCLLTQATWEWADVADGNPPVKPGYGIAEDQNNNLYVAGSFYGEISFQTNGYAIKDIITLNSQGQNDILLVKYNNNGECQWARQAGGDNHDEAFAITIDKKDNIIITGYFFGTATFDDIVLTATGVYDIFIAKYNSDGVLLWVKQEGGFGLNSGQSLATDENDFIYVTGRFGGNAFENCPTPLHSYGTDDVFVAKYKPNGELIWAQQAGGKYSDQANALILDSENNVYITGFFSDIALFRPHSSSVETAQHYILRSKGQEDIFLAKYDENGNFKWVKQAGSKFDDIAYSITTDDESVYITGKFFNSAYFDGILLKSSIERSDGFIAKYTKNGGIVFARKLVKQFGDNGTNWGRAITTRNGSFYILGDFKGTIELNNGESLSCNTNSFNLWSTNAYIAKYDNEWKVQWVKQVGSLWDHVFSLTVDNNFDVYTTGSVAHSVDFDGLTFTGLGDGDFFIAKITET